MHPVRIEMILVVIVKRMRQSVVRDALKLLESGDDVVWWLRDKCASTGSLSVAMSRIKTAWMKGAPVPPSFAEVMAVYRNEPGVETFLSLPLSEMVRVQREHRSDPMWSEEAELTLQSLVLLPQNVAALKLSHQELISLKRKREDTLISKQEALLHVHNATTWLQCAIIAARISTPDMSFPRLALPLLLLSGRRTSEILNGKSSFESTGPTTCLFKGQIKKRGNDAPYEIPLLCDFATFTHAVNVLRLKQGGEVFEPEACTNRYSHMLKEEISQLFSFATHVHELRAVYAAMAFHLYQCNTTFNRAAMRILGHEKLDVSLSYNAVMLHGMPPLGSLGALP